MRPEIVSCARRKPGADEIPVPRVAANAVAGISQWLVLQAVRVEPDAETVRNEEVAIARDEVRHGAAPPDVAVQPETSGHRVHHPVAPPLELEPAYGTTGRTVDYWQPIRPSFTAGDTGVMLPKKMAQVSGNDAGCVAIAPHPEPLAVAIVSTTPGDVANDKFDRFCV